MAQNDQLSAGELYDLALHYYKANDKSSLVETCEILMCNFPDSNEAKWASNRFELSRDDCDKCGEKIPPITAKCHCGGHRIPEPPKPTKLPKTPTPPPKKLVPCRVCEKEIATEAATCPNCGIAYPGKSAFGGSVINAGNQYQKMASIIAAILMCFLIVKCNSGA